MTPSWLGLSTATAVFVADQASKIGLGSARGLGWDIGFDLPAREPVALLPFLDLIVVWNRGISYGLFQQGSDVGRWLLVVFSVVATVALLWWMRTARTRSLALALGLLAGGALGNAVDRAAYGAVFDFVHLHWGSWSWYVFNIADIAIVAGVLGLVYDSLFDRRDAARVS